jgi:serine/threonine protein kinase
MGDVWVAHHLALDAPIAIKFLRPEILVLDDMLARFQREAKAAAQIRSPHVVQILDHGADGQHAYITMELLEGEDLSARIAREKRVPLDKTVDILTQAARGLGRAHEMGIVHRDLKPANLFLVRVDRQGSEIVKIVDFGIAKAIDTGIASLKTVEGASFGSPEYMSPEQVRDASSVDHRADLWSLGVIAYQCLTGRRPFRGSPGQVVVDIFTADVPRASELASDLPPALDEVFARALARDPADRYSSAPELAEAFARAARGSAAPRLDDGPTPLLAARSPAPPASTPAPPASPPASPASPGATAVAGASPEGTMPARRPRGGGASALRAGMRLGRYELLLLVGGGATQVWVARPIGAPGSSPLVEVKTISSSAADAVVRRALLAGAKLASRIHHTNVVELLDAGEEGSTVFLATALVEGPSLDVLLRRSRHRAGAEGLPAAIVVRVMADVAAGLHAAHELGGDGGAPLAIVHHALSPRSVHVGVDGVAKVTDLGIAEAMGRVIDTEDGGRSRGKSAYLSPEQVEGRPVDRRTDVFAAGVVLWEALTGARAVRGDGIAAPEPIAAARIPDPRSLVPTLPAALAEITLRAVATDPAARFQTAAELRDALEAAGRVAGLGASAEDVARFVALRSGDDLAVRRDALRDALVAWPASAPSPEPLVDDAPRPPAPVIARVSWAVRFAAAGVLALGMVGVTLAVVSGRPPSPPVLGAASTPIGAATTGGTAAPSPSITTIVPSEETEGPADGGSTSAPVMPTFQPSARPTAAGRTKRAAGAASEGPTKVPSAADESRTYR